MLSMHSSQKSFTHSTRPLLTSQQQAIVDRVIEAARQTPGSLRMLNRCGQIFTALHRRGRTSWRIESVHRQPIANGDR